MNLDFIKDRSTAFDAWDFTNRLLEALVPELGILS